MHRADFAVGRRKRSGITLIQKNDLITFNLAHYGADVQRGENAMRLWRKNLLMVGFVFVAAAVITAVVFSQFDILNYTAEGVIPIALEVIAAICFAVFAITRPYTENWFPRTLAAIVAAGIPAFVWYAIWFVD